MGMLSARRRQAIPALSGSVLVCWLPLPSCCGHRLRAVRGGHRVPGRHRAGWSRAWSTADVRRCWPCLAVAAARAATAPLVAAGSVWPCWPIWRWRRDRADHRAGQRCGRAPNLPWPAGAQVLIRSPGEVWWVCAWRIGRGCAAATVRWPQVCRAYCWSVAPPCSRFTQWLALVRAAM